MSVVRTFVDTNVLIYAHDPGQGAKHRKAMGLVERLWVARSGIVSTQVLQEFYVNLRTKISSPLPLERRRKILENYFRWRIIVNDSSTIEGAFRLEDRYGLSFWDAMIVQAALTARATVLVSEDLQHGQSFEGLEVRNPFIA